MASSKSYLEFIMDQFSGLDGISWRAMMGEYIIYLGEKIVGGIYDDRFLVNPTKSASAMMPNAAKELPYEGAKEMLLVDDVENRAFLAALLTAVYEELPAPKKRKYPSSRPKTAAPDGDARIKSGATHRNRKRLDR